MASERAAPRVFMVSTEASKPSLRCSWSAWARAKVVTWPGTTSWLTSWASSGSEIWSEALIS